MNYDKEFSFIRSQVSAMLQHPKDMIRNREVVDTIVDFLMDNFSSEGFSEELVNCFGEIFADVPVYNPNPDANTFEKMKTFINISSCKYSGDGFVFAVTVYVNRIFYIKPGRYYDKDIGMNRFMKCYAPELEEYKKLKTRRPDPVSSS